MLRELLVALYVAGAGFTAAGLLDSLFQLVTAKPLRFMALPGNRPGRLCEALVIVVAGPLVILRGAPAGHRIEAPHLGWLMARTVVAGIWSVLTGIVVVYLALTLWV
jgi:hypothetical protein